MYTNYLTKLDAIYRDGPFFDGVRARLLAAFVLLLLVFVPLNVASLLWMQPSFYPARIMMNVIMALAGLLSAHLLFKGRLALAGNTLAIALIVPSHLAVLLPGWLEPLGLEIKIFSYDIVFLFAALVFASRRIAIGLLGVIVSTHIAFYFLAMQGQPMPGSLEFAATTLRRDGGLATGFVFLFGISVLHMIEVANRRSEQSLRETRAVNANLERLVSERTRELERLNEEKNEFMGMAAHDLRNPAVKIRMLAELVEMEGDYSEARVRADLATIAETAQRQLGLLGDLLDVTAIEQGRITLRPVSLDARAILRDVHTDFLRRALAKDLTLELTPPPLGAPAALPVVVDPNAIRQVLDNLVSNALKYSPAGKRVWLSVEPIPGGRVRFAVRDEGPGLSTSDHARLFGKYHRLSAQPTGGETSTGLGLSIVKRLVDGMSGHIIVESVPGHGATFAVDFPSVELTGSGTPFRSDLPDPFSIARSALANPSGHPWDFPGLSTAIPTVLSTPRRIV